MPQFIKITVAWQRCWNTISQKATALLRLQCHSASRKDTNIGAMDRCAGLYEESG